jgi:hypothetical protein
VASNLVARQKCIPTRRNRHTANPAAPNQLLTPSRVALSRRLTPNPAVPNQRLTPNPAALNQHPTPNRDALNQLLTPSRVALNQLLTPSRDTLNQLLTRSRAVQNDRLRAHRTRRPRQLQSPMNGLRPPLRNIQPLGLKRIQRRIQLPSRSQRPPRSRSRRNHASLQQELEAEKSSARFADHYPPKAHNWSCDDQRTGSRIQYRCNNRQV